MLAQLAIFTFDGQEYRIGLTDETTDAKNVKKNLLKNQLFEALEIKAKEKE